MRRVPLLFLCATAAYLVGCAHCSPQECDAMLDRYLDMTEDDDPALAGLAGAPRAGLRAERVAERRASTGYVEAEGRCTREVSRAAFACAMKAPTPNDWEACVTP